MPSPTLQWSAAEVNDGVLMVPIEGDRPKGWKRKFEQVVSVLGGGPSGEVVCKSGNVRVSAVVEGSEEELHHFLEAVLQETNSALGAGDDPDERNDDGGEAADEGVDVDVDDADARLTDVFRDFAG